MTRLFITGFLFLLFSCSTPPPAVQLADKPVADNVRLAPLRSLLKKIQLLPNGTYTVTFDFPPGKELYEVNGASPDSLFFQSGASLYGVLADTSHFYSFLSYAPVENGALTVTTIDKAGQVVDEQQLSTGLYGSGCGYIWFGKVYVNQDQSFLIRDSLVTFDCDSLGPQPAEKWKHEIATLAAKILPDGKIAFARLQTLTVKEPAQ